MRAHLSSFKLHLLGKATLAPDVDTEAPLAPVSTLSHSVFSLAQDTILFSCDMYLYIGLFPSATLSPWES